jgi:hypothetical protein
MRLRLTTRRMMVGVAVLAPVLVLGRWFAETEKRREYRRSRWLHHSFSAQFIANGGGVPPIAARVAYHNAMANKWGRSDRFLWLPVWPDPPEPK